MGFLKFKRIHSNLELVIDLGLKKKTKRKETQSVNEATIAAVHFLCNPDDQGDNGPDIRPVVRSTGRATGRSTSQCKLRLFLKPQLGMEEDHPGTSSGGPHFHRPHKIMKSVQFFTLEKQRRERNADRRSSSSQLVARRPIVQLVARRPINPLPIYIPWSSRANLSRVSNCVEAPLLHVHIVLTRGMSTTDGILEELLNVEVELQDVQDHIKILLDRQEKLYERQSELKALLEDCDAPGSPRNDGTAVTVENWSGPFEWDSQVDDLRFNIFGISNYRANQREVSAISGVRLIFLETTFPPLRPVYVDRAKLD
ncbi:hypothetical protein HYC85_027557 [Camellia sinensis]|uniref:Uncharacterized protein n=1 Tax=Camellia sinensis TaxID=4442 RepID=A0A7J7GAD1_CAMSI|nr:hypothetical protein HYC85_027557 [Camellia sinensis]